MSGIFISYRRTDTEHAAGRLADAVIAEFGREQVFMDVDAIDPGVDFVVRIQDVLKQCRVILVLIGDEWLTVTDNKGRQRLQRPDDYVRVEIARALKRKEGAEEVRIIPLLVGRAEMPGSDELPDDLARLARLNAIDLSHNRWHEDVRHLIEYLRHLFDVWEAQETPPVRDLAPVPPPEPEPQREAESASARGRRRGPLIAGAAALALVIAVVLVLAGGDDGNDTESNTEEVRRVVEEFSTSSDPSVCNLGTQLFHEQVWGGSGPQAVVACRTELPRLRRSGQVSIQSLELSGGSASAEVIFGDGEEGEYSLVETQDGWRLNGYAPTKEGSNTRRAR